MIFKNRIEAGQRLAKDLAKYKGQPDLVVLALPRGGVPVGYEVARELDALLDVLIVRKLGVPGHEEMAMGAIASGGNRIMNEDIVRRMQISDDAIERITEKERKELKRRQDLYQPGEPIDIEGKTVILVDDGLATGATMTAAVTAVKDQNPAKIVVAVPVASSSTCKMLKSSVDEIVCSETPEPFYAVGTWYQSFPQTSDQEVRELMERANETLMA